MKKLLLYMAMLSIISATALAETITLKWDVVEGIDGYRIYSAIRKWNPETQQNEHTWDFTAPVTTAEYPDGNIPQEVDTIDVELTGIEDIKVKYLFVGRSYLGDDVSENSNEVSYEYDLSTPPAPDSLTGWYDPENQVINLSWSQTPEEYNTVDHWTIFYKLAEGDYVELGTVDDEQNLNLATDFDAVPAGETAMVEFVAVAFRRSGKFSANSESLIMTIDRRPEVVVPPMENLRINVSVPVQ